jgi:hypothetical protein
VTEQNSAGEREPIRVLVVDDQELFRRGVTMLLGVESGVGVVGDAGDGVEGTALATSAESGEPSVAWTRVLALCDRVDVDVLGKAAPVAAVARKMGLEMRLDTADDLVRGADAFPDLALELLDTKRLVRGDDVLASLALDVHPDDLRLRLEQSLRALHQDLVRRAVPGAAASVHHTEYPKADLSLIDDDLERRMAAARRVVALGHAARHRAGLKVRMPLPRLVAVFDGSDHDRGLLDGTGELADLVKDELNVKQFEVRDDAGGLVRSVVKPDLKVLGPRLGKDLARVRKALAEDRYERSDGKYVVEGFTLDASEVLVSHEGTLGHAVGRDLGAVAVLETTLTPELELEGLAREIARRVNDLRKDAGLEIDDRIVLRYDGEIVEAVERYREQIAEEVLAVRLQRGVGAGAWRAKLNGVGAALQVQRA